MNWEHIGKQELRSKSKMVWSGGYMYLAEMWRTPVPGGWLIMSLNSRSNSPDPVISFYPDEDHIWQPNEPQEEAYLLRASSHTAVEEDADQLLRAAPGENSESKRLSG
jgi:hypothetical protein